MQPNCGEQLQVGNWWATAWLTATAELAAAIITATAIVNFFMNVLLRLTKTKICRSLEFLRGITVLPYGFKRD
jgi:hypothetical protein